MHLDLYTPRNIYDINYATILESKDPAKEIETLYNNLSNRYAFKIYPVESAHNTYYNLFHMMRRLTNSGRIKEAKKLVQLGLNYYPNSSNFYYRLALINQAEKDKENTLLHLKKAISLAKKYKHENLSLFEKELKEFTSKN